MSLSGDPAESFVFAGWIRSYLAAAAGGEDGDPPAELAHYLVRADPETAQHVVRAYIRDLIEGGASVYVAAAEDDPQLFLGFICVGAGVAHYLYCKRRVRRRGVAIALLAHAEAEHGTITRATTTTWPWTLAWAARRGILYCPIIGSHAPTKTTASAGVRRSDHTAGTAA